MIASNIDASSAPQHCCPPDHWPGSSRDQHPDLPSENIHETSGALELSLAFAFARGVNCREISLGADVRPLSEDAVQSAVIKLM